MPHYRWKNKSDTGRIQAKNKMIARIILRKNGINNAVIYREINWIKLTQRKPSFSKKIELFDSLKLFLKSGMDLRNSLMHIKKQTSNSHIKLILTNIEKSIQNGQSLTEAFSSHPDFSDPLTLSLILLGESTGTLEKQLDVIIHHHKKYQALVSSIKQSLTYPCVIMISTIFVTTILLKFAIPPFIEIFSTANLKVPALTANLIELSNAINWNNIGITMLVSMTLLIIFRQIKKRKSFRKVLDKTLLRISLYRETLIARYCHILSSTLNAGLPLSDSLSLVINISRNSIYIELFKKTLSSIEKGHPLSKTLKPPIIPMMLYSLLLTGEETGRLGEIFKQASTLYEGRLQQKIDRLTRLIEPVIISFLAGFVGLIVIALYLPIFNIGNAIL